MLLDLHVAVVHSDVGAAGQVDRHFQAAIEANFGTPGLRLADVAIGLGLRPYELARAFRAARACRPARH